MMIGADIQPIRTARKASTGAARLVVRNLTLAAADPFGTNLDCVSFSVAGGEILGFAGVSGNGQQELLAALSGETPLADPHGVVVDDKPVGRLDPRQRRAIGLCSVPEDRLGRGAVPSLSLADNLLLTDNRQSSVRAGFIRFDVVEAFAERCIAEFGVRGGGPDADAGNLQEFIVGQEILQDPGVLVIAQPTWGVIASVYPATVSF